MRAFIVLAIAGVLVGCGGGGARGGFAHRAWLASESRAVFDGGGEVFGEAVPFWNLAEGSAAAEVRVRGGRGGRGGGAGVVWGPWFGLTGPGASEGEGWRLDIDTLLGDAEVYEVERVGRGADGAQRGGVIGIVATREDRDVKIGPARGERVALRVPFRSQRTDDAALKGRLCSPTSATMVMAYWGVDVSVGQVAAAAYDPFHDVYGNWPRNMQAVHELSAGKLRAEVRRFATFGELRAELERGRPVVISVAGRLRGAPYSPTEGHLLVVRGMTSAGDVLVNDPAFGTEAEGAREYRWEDLREAWLRNRKGTAYVIAPAEEGR